MRMEYLKAFLSIVDSGSIANAARIENMTQPAVSRILKLLEEELETTLITRTQGQRAGIKLTHSGSVFAAYARKTYNEYEHLLLDLQRQEGTELSLRVVSSTGPGATILPSLLRYFSIKFPQVSVSSQSLGGFPNALSDEDSRVPFDIGISSSPAQDSLLESIPFFQEQYVLIAPRSMNLPPKIAVRELKKLTFISQPNFFTNIQAIDRELQRHNLSLNELNIIATVRTDADVLMSVSRGVGVGFVTSSLLSTLNRSSDIMTVQVGALNMRRVLYLIRKKSDRHDISNNMFWEFAQTTAWRDNFRFDSVIK